MSIKDDLKQYPCYLFRHKKLIKLNEPPTSWYGFQIHHFVRQSIRKNSLDFYKRVEHLQKLILMPAQMNYDLEQLPFNVMWKSMISGDYALGIEPCTTLFHQFKMVPIKKGEKKNFNLAISFSEIK